MDTWDWLLSPRRRRITARLLVKTLLFGGFALIAGVSLVYAQVPPVGAPAAGVYNVTPPTFRDKTAATLQTDANGVLKVVGGGSGGGGTVIGAVSSTATVCVTPTVTATNSYGTNFVVGGVLTFANAFTATGTGILQNVTVNIKALETSGFTFFPFTSAPAAMADAAVSAIAAADVNKVRGPVPLGLNNQLAATGFSVYYGYGLGLALAPGTTSLSGVLVANAALTTQFAAATDVQVCVTVLQDP